MKPIYLLLCLIPLLSACVVEEERPYRQDELQNLVITRTAAGQLLLTCQPRLETLYHYAGARWYRDDDTLVVQLIRCPINTICQVDNKPIPDDDLPSKSHMMLPEARLFYLDDGQHRWPLSTP